MSKVKKNEVMFIPIMRCRDSGTMCCISFQKFSGVLFSLSVRTVNYIERCTCWPKDMACLGERIRKHNNNRNHVNEPF